jgi:hypothetical protein
MFVLGGGGVCARLFLGDYPEWLTGSVAGFFGQHRLGLRYLHGNGFALSS